MRTPSSLLLLAAAACATAPTAPKAPAAPTQATGGKPVDDRDLSFLQALAQTKGFSSGRPAAVRLTRDGRTALFLRAEARSPEQRLYAFDLQSGQVRELASAAQVQAGQGGPEQLSAEEKARRERMRISARGIVGYEISQDGTQVLFSLSGRAYVVPVAGGQPREVAGPGPKGEPLFDARLSPDAASVAFVRGGELWVAPVAGGAARQLTHGATATLTHAQAEFVAQEELSRYTGYWWAPDSKQLVYEEADSAEVEQLYLKDAAKDFQAPQQQAYPRPGKRNVRWRFGLVPVGGGETRWLSGFDPKWEYVARVVWRDNGPLSFIVLTRDQKTLAVLQAGADGAVRELLRETDPAWVNANQGLPLGGAGDERDLAYLPNGRFLWASEKNGAWQLFLNEGGAERALTAPEWGFVKIAGLAGESVFVVRAPDPISLEVWELPLAGGEAKKLAGGNVLPSFAPGGRAYALHVEPEHGTPEWQVFRADGSRAGTLPSVAEAPPFAARPEFRRVGDSGKPTVGSGPTGFWTVTIKPREFDPARKYPVLLSVYGGPHHNEVGAGASRYVADQWVADHGYIVVHADGRGTQRRGRDWERAIQDRFSEVPLDDQVAALQALGQVDPSLDLSRVGVKGHSFGGFLAALAVMRRPDVFKGAIAGAPVVDWLNYDTAYTERYLGVPAPAGPSTVYEKNGLLAYAKDLQRPLLLLHGTADDNVHFSESLLLTDALFRAGKHFELIPFVGQTHMFVSPQLVAREWERIFTFLRENVEQAR